jgi:hypothetical protein
MDADLVPRIANRAQGRGIDQTGYGGDEEAGPHIMVSKNVQNARHAGAAPELAPGKPADGATTCTQFERLVVAIE